MNIVEQLLLVGFKDPVFPNFNPKNNWFGVSLYHPDVCFERESKTAIFSLNGCLMNTDITKEKYEELKPIFDEMKAKYICLRSGKEIIYETYTGVLPSEKILNDFLN